MRKAPTRALWLRIGGAFVCTIAGFTLIWAGHGAPRIIGLVLAIVGGVGTMANGIWMRGGGGYR